MSKKKKTAEIVCAAVMLAMAVPFTVWAQEQVDVDCVRCTTYKKRELHI